MDINDLNKINELDRRMIKHLQNFSYEMKANIATKGDEPLNKYDFEEMARQTFYCFDDMRQDIIKYLKEQ